MVKVAFPLLFLNLCTKSRITAPKYMILSVNYLKMINNPEAKKVNEEQIYHKLLFSH